MGMTSSNHQPQALHRQRLWVKDEYENIVRKRLALTDFYPFQLIVRTIKLNPSGDDHFPAEHILHKLRVTTSSIQPQNPCLTARPFVSMRHNHLQLRTAPHVKSQATIQRHEGRTHNSNHPEIPLPSRKGKESEYVIQSLDP